MPNLFKITNRLPLMTVLVIPFVVQIIVTVGAVGYFSLQGGQQTVSAIANRLIDEMSDRVTRHLDEYMAMPHRIDRMNFDAIDTELIDVKDFQRSSRFFWRQLQVFPDINFISYTLTTGEFAGAGIWNEKKRIYGISERSAKTNGKTHVYLTDSQGNRTKLVHIYDEYEPLQETWYVEAIASGEPSWGQIYPREEAPRTLSISASYPIRDRNDKIVGVLSVDLALANISNFLRQLKISDRGKVFIIEHNGLLVASSSTETPYKIVAGKADRLNINESQDPLIREVAKDLQTNFGSFQDIDRLLSVELQAKGERYFVRVVPWHDRYGLDWLSIVVVPESDFMSQIETNTRKTLMLCVASFILSVGIGFLTAKWLTDPILRVNKAAEAIAAGDFDQTIETTRTDELGKLARSFNQMAAQLRSSFKTLESSNQELEQKVRERTTSLISAEIELRAMFRSITELIFVLDRQGRYIKIMAIQPEWLQGPYNLTLGETIADILPPETAQKLDRYLRTVLDRQKSISIEYSLNLNGKLIWFAANVSPISHQSVVWVARNITDRKQAEAALQQKNQDLENAIAQLKAAQTELIQSEKMAALGQLIANIAHEINTPLGAIQASIGNISRFLDESCKQLPQLFRRLSPEQLDDFFILVDLVRHPKVFLSFRQERQIKRSLQKFLQQRQIEPAEILADTLSKMGIVATTGSEAELEREIAPLMRFLRSPENATILEAAYMLSAMQNNSQNVKLAVERAAKIVTALKTYVRQDTTGKMAIASIADGIDTVLTLYQNQLKKGIEVIKNYDEVAPIFCYPEELSQVWSNLASNAIAAMGERGQLQIDISERDSYVVISVTDSGSGISPEIQDKIFEPFFTTKPIGEGTGLGLDIVRKIVDKHSGTINFTSQSGNTKFTVLLPALRERG